MYVSRIIGISNEDICGIHKMFVEVVSLAFVYIRFTTARHSSPYRECPIVNTAICYYITNKNSVVLRLKRCVQKGFAAQSVQVHPWPSAKQATVCCLTNILILSFRILTRLRSFSFRWSFPTNIV